MVHCVAILRLILRTTFGAFMALAANAACATSLIIYSTGLESIGTTGLVGGISVDATQYLGVRFQADADYEVDEIGGHFGGVPGTTLFGAIFSISGPSDIPNLAALELDPGLIGYSVFSVPQSSQVVYAPISAALEAGEWYALVFGSGKFGAIGDGYTPNAGVTINTGANSFWYVPQTNALYVPMPYSTLGYFALRGTPVSIPGSIALLGVGLPVVLLARLRRARRPSVAEPTWV